MTPVERKLAECILERPEVVINETVTHLAKRAGISTGSVANFAVSMGFSGFSDMKIQIARSLEKGENLTFDGVYVWDNPQGAMYKIISSAQKSFRETYEVTAQALTPAAQLLMNARRIEVYASGSSLPVGLDACSRLMRIGLSAIMVQDSLLASLSASHLGKEDVVFAVSHKGQTVNTINPAQIAKSKGAKIISLTSFQHSPLAKLSDVCLVSVSSEVAEQREAVLCRLSQLLIIDSLCAYIKASRPTEALRYQDNEIQILEKYRNTAQEE